METIDLAQLSRVLTSKDRDAIYFACSVIRQASDIPLDIKRHYLSKASVYDKIRYYSDICLELGVEELTIEHFNFLPIEQREKMLAYHKICNISKIFNAGWVPNFTDLNQRKFFPYFIKNKDGSWSVASFADFDVDCSALGFGLYFKEEELALFAVNLFKEIYIKYLPD